MSLLASIEKPKDRALMATILGDAGMGKTRLAAAFPKPIFIRAEDGMQSIPRDQRPDAFAKLEKVDDLWQQMTALIHEDHDYKTLVIDSVTALERLFGEDVLTRDGKAKALAHALGGFGAGYQAVGTAHQRLRKAAGILNTQKRMNVIFIAHADVETMKSPDMDDYMRYTLRLNQKYSLAPYVDDVDLVGFVRLQSFVKGDDGERKKAISTGARELVCHATASNISKNRYGITQVLPFDEGANPLAGLVPIAGMAKPKPAKDAPEGAPAETEPQTTPEKETAE
jgi:hypothetical protein